MSKIEFETSTKSTARLKLLSSNSSTNSVSIMNVEKKDIMQCYCVGSKNTCWKIGSTENALKGKCPKGKWPSYKGKWPRWKIWQN